MSNMTSKRQPTSGSSTSADHTAKKSRSLLNQHVYKIWPSSLTRAGHTTVSIDDPNEDLFHFFSNVKPNAAGVHMGRMQQVPCLFVPSSKFRHGAERWWCPVHQGQYGLKAQLEETKRSGVRRCDQAQDFVDFVKQDDIPVLRLTAPEEVTENDHESYCELGVWIGLPPAVDTVSHQQRYFPGIHVHARKEFKGKKVIDTNYPAVTIQDRTGRFLSLAGSGITVTPPAALEFLYYMENKCPVNRRLQKLGLDSTAGTNFSYNVKLPRSPVELGGEVRCKHCQALHEDIGDFFGETPHKKHLCGQCGRAIVGKGNIGNPLMAFHRKFHRRIVGEGSDETDLATLRIDSSEYDLMLWPSTPALFWSREEPEVWGVHVHAISKKSGEREIDDTYGAVWVDGKQLDRADLFKKMLQATSWMKDNPSERAKAIELEDD